LANGGRDDNEDEEMPVAGPSGFKTHVQEEEDLRAETKAAFFNALDESGDEDGNDSEDGGLLVKREAQESDDEDQYRRFLLDTVGEEEMERALAIRRENDKMAVKAGTAPSQDEDDFLKKYA
jgi:protein KRI1